MGIMPVVHPLHPTTSPSRKLYRVLQHVRVIGLVVRGRGGRDRVTKRTSRWLTIVLGKVSKWRYSLFGWVLVVDEAIARITRCGTQSELSRCNCLPYS